MRISFFTQNYSLEGCFNVGNSEHVKDVEAKIIVQVPDGKYKSLRHLCDFLWFLRLVIGCLRLYREPQYSTNWYRLNYNQYVKINEKP